MHADFKMKNLIVMNLNFGLHDRRSFAMVFLGFSWVCFIFCPTETWSELDWPIKTTDPARLSTFYYFSALCDGAILSVR